MGIDKHHKVCLRGFFNMRKEKIIKIMKITGLLYGIAFILTTIVFIFFDSLLISTINAMSQHLYTSLPLAQEQSQFFKVLAVSMMAGVTACAFMIYKNTASYIEMSIPLVIMKFTSSFCGLVAFIYGCIYHYGWNTLANLIIFITDFPLGVWMLYLYRLCKRNS